jgi:amino acid transporter
VNGHNSHRSILIGLTPKATALRRELGARDITLFAISCVIGTRWIAAAAHAGPGSIILWFLGAIFFVGPLAVAVATLTVKYPSAGGMYVWTRNDFGPWHGFLSFVCYWTQMAVWFPSAAMFYLGAAAFAFGPRFAHLADNRTFVVTASLLVIWVALGSNIVGMKVGKWTENVGGAASWILAAVLITVGWLVWQRQGSATPLNFEPTWNWDTVNLWGVVAFAMSGLEMVGFMAGEIRNPQRDVPRAAWISSAFSIVFYSATTLALLVILRPANISEVNGLAQSGLQAGLILKAPWLAPLIALLVLATAIGQFGGIGSSVSRLPYAAGVDQLLPAVFARLHPRWSTPYVAILTLGLAASALLFLLQLGDTIRAAYQSLVSLMVITGFLPYLYIFGSSWKAGKRVSAISGIVVTVLVIVCSVVPTSEIHDVWAFEAKLALGTVGTLSGAWFLYCRARIGRIQPVR